MRHRVYMDVNGVYRKIKFLRNVPGVVVPYRRVITQISYSKYEANPVWSPVQMWELEDGYIAQIPTEAWTFCNIKYKDVEVL